MRQEIVHRQLERPDVDVLVHGSWHRGEVQVSTQLDDGTWWLRVQYRVPEEMTPRIDDFPEHRVRQVVSSRVGARA